MAKSLKLINQNLTEVISNSQDARSFLAKITDKNSFVEYDTFLSGSNLVYAKVPVGEGIVTGWATISDYPVYIAVQNAEILGGSFGVAHAQKLIRCIDRAIKAKVPFVSVIDSSGLRIGEGIQALDGYAKVIAKINELRNVSYHISIVNGPATGLMAVYAATSDFLFISADSKKNSRGASISMGSPMSLSALAGLNKPAEEVLGASQYVSNGIAEGSFKTPTELKKSLDLILESLERKTSKSKDDPNRITDNLNENSSPKVIIDALVDDGKYLEVYKNDAPSIKTILASINTIPVGIAITAADNTRRLTVDSIKKLTRFIKLLNKSKSPLINIVDCEGILTDLESEKNGIIRETVELFEVLATCKQPKVSVITGDAIGMAYVALASKDSGYDYVVAFSTARIAALTADVAVNLLYADELNGTSDPIKARKTLEDRYNLDEINPFVSAKSGSIDTIIEPALLRPYIASYITSAVMD
ncbi:MAG: hypothetical protein LBF68_01260 [Christensenellaceae bacterium]|jgi:propionyl-CoA carboxylase beta chain|nr:hypothetical protein [Christensenellaceae bacterium]